MDEESNNFQSMQGNKIKQNDILKSFVSKISPNDSNLLLSAISCKS